MVCSPSACIRRDEPGVSTWPSKLWISKRRMVSPILTCSIPMAGELGLPSFSSWTGLAPPAITCHGTSTGRGGYYVVQPNLYCRAGRSPLLNAAKVFVDDAETAKLFRLARQLTPDTVVRDIGAWLQFLSRQTEVKGNTVGAVGYCTGGAMVMRAAAHYPDSIVAAASFHGAALGAKSPDSPHQLASRIRAKPHIGLAETDFWMPPR